MASWAIERIWPFLEQPGAEAVTEVQLWHGLFLEDHPGCLVENGMAQSW